MRGVLMKKRRERFNMSLEGETLERVDNMALNLHMTRSDVLEVMAHFFLAYVGCNFQEKLQDMKKGRAV